MNFPSFNNEIATSDIRIIQFSNPDINRTCGLKNTASFSSPDVPGTMVATKGKNSAVLFVREGTSSGDYMLVCQSPALSSLSSDHLKIEGPRVDSAKNHLSYQESVLITLTSHLFNPICSFSNYKKDIGKINHEVPCSFSYHSFNKNGSDKIIYHIHSEESGTREDGVIDIHVKNHPPSATLSLTSSTMERNWEQTITCFGNDSDFNQQNTLSFHISASQGLIHHCIKSNNQYQCLYKANVRNYGDVDITCHLHDKYGLQTTTHITIKIVPPVLLEETSNEAPVLIDAKIMNIELQMEGSGIANYWQRLDCLLKQYIGNSFETLSGSHMSSAVIKADSSGKALLNIEEHADGMVAGQIYQLHCEAFEGSTADHINSSIGTHISDPWMT